MPVRVIFFIINFESGWNCWDCSVKGSHRSIFCRSSRTLFFPVHCYFLAQSDVCYFYFSSYFLIFMCQQPPTPPPLSNSKCLEHILLTRNVEGGFTRPSFQAANQPPVGHTDFHHLDSIKFFFLGFVIPFCRSDYSVAN